MVQFLNVEAKVRAWKAVKGLAMCGMLLAGFLVVGGPNRATAEVTNRLTVYNSTGGTITFYINGQYYLTISGSSGDCYPARYGVRGDLLLEARDYAGHVIKQSVQTGRVNNFTWNVP
jgi:hypothetical protein